MMERNATQCTGYDACTPQVVGATEELVGSAEEMLQCLERGTVGRSVGSTSMNAVSSRSHAIFQIVFTQNSITSNGKEVINMERVR